MCSCLLPCCPSNIISSSKLVKYNLTRFLNKPWVSGGDDDEPDHTPDWYSWNPNDPGPVRLCVSLLSLPVDTRLLRFTNYTPCFNANLDRPDQISLHPQQGVGDCGRRTDWNLSIESSTPTWTGGRSGRMASHFYPGVVGVGWWNSHKSFLIELRQEITSKLSPTHSHRAKHDHLSARNTNYLRANYGHTYGLIWPSTRNNGPDCDQA